MIRNEEIYGNFSHFKTRGVGAIKGLFTTKNDVKMILWQKILLDPPMSSMEVPPRPHWDPGILKKSIYVYKKDYETYYRVEGFILFASV